MPLKLVSRGRRRRRSAPGLWASICVCLVGSWACTRARSPSKQNPANTVTSDAAVPSMKVAGTSVKGRVIDPSGQVFSGWRVAVGVASGTVPSLDGAADADADGTFVLDDVAPHYDMYAVAPDKMQISVYYGLSRRDPIVVPVWPGHGRYPSWGSIAGSLAGGVSFPLDRSERVTVSVSFFSAGGFARQALEPGLGRPGPAYGPMRIALSGVSAVPGKVVALAMPWSLASGTQTSPALGLRDVTVAPGETQNHVDLSMDAIPIGKISGSVTIDGDAVAEMVFAYHPADAIGYLNLGQLFLGRNGTFSHDLPDMSKLAGDYCITISDYIAHGTARKCGIAVGATDVSMHVRPRPKILSPSPGAAVTKNTRLSWTSVENGVHRLSCVSGDPTAPALHAYTSENVLRWPDLRDMGITFPATVEYECRVSRFTPQKTTDDATSHSFDAFGVDQQQIDSTTFRLTVAP